MADPVKSGVLTYVDPPQVGIPDAPASGSAMEFSDPPVTPDPTNDTARQMVPNPIADQGGANRHKGKNQVVIPHTDVEPNPLTDPVAGTGGRQEANIPHSD